MAEASGPGFDSRRRSRFFIFFLCFFGDGVCPSSDLIEGQINITKQQGCCKYGRLSIDLAYVDGISVTHGPVGSR